MNIAKKIADIYVAVREMTQRKKEEYKIVLPTLPISEESGEIYVPGTDMPCLYFIGDDGKRYKYKGLEDNR
jgi:hypothetical protein